jgi:hypothetical protein
MTKLSAVLLGVVLTNSALAFQPRTGNWWNSAEPGSGFNIEIQDSTIVVTIYSYQPAGAAQWYLASGPMDKNTFYGTLDKYVGGQCIACTATSAPTRTGNDGNISIVFASETSALVTLPGGRTTRIEPFNFAIGDPPTGLLGEWIFVYDEGPDTLGERFHLSSVLAPTSTGNGVVADLSKIAGCELQISGELAGIVICGHGDTAGNLLSAYAFRFGLDQTYDGLSFSPPNPTGTLYPMKGFKVQSKTGISNQSARPIRAASAAAANSAPAADSPAVPEHASGLVAQAVQDAIRQAAPRSRIPSY